MIPVEGQNVTPSVRLVRPLGAGGMGAVWIAEHLTLQTRVVVKFMSPELALDANARQRFSREAAAAAAVKSPHVVQMLDHGIADGTPFIVMELLEGEDLRHRMEREGALPLDDVAVILSQVCRALGRAHAAGVVHRDIKPDNIFLSKGDDGETFAKLLDFGIAKKADAAMGATKTGALMGTPYYMSPEQAVGARGIDLRTDLWSLGVVAFEAMTGVKAFDGENIGALAVAITHGAMPVPSRVNAALSPVDAWFARACARTPEARFGSAKEMADAFNGASGPTPPARAPHKPTTAKQPEPAALLSTTTGPTSGNTDDAVFAELERARRSRVLLRRIAEGFVASLVVVIAGGWLFVKWGNERERNNAWSDVSMCLFGGPPPLGGKTAAHLRAIQRHQFLDMDEHLAWPRRCGDTIDAMLDKLKATNFEGEDLIQSLRTLRERTTDKLVETNVYAGLVEDVEQQLKQAKIEYRSSRTPAPPAPVEALDIGLLTAGGVAPREIGDKSVNADDEDVLRYYRTSRGKPELLELDGQALRATSLFASSASNCTSCVTAAAAMRWDAPVVFGKPGAPLLLVYSDDDSNWVVRADGASLVLPGKYLLAGAGSTPDLAAALVKARTSDLQSEQFVLVRLARGDIVPKTENVTLAGWSGPAGEWSALLPGRATVRIVDDWIVWFTKDGSIDARRLQSGDSALGPVQTVGKKLLVTGILQTAGSTRLQTCRTNEGVVLPFDPFSPQSTFAVAAADSWSVHDTHQLGKVTCEAGAVDVVNGTQYVRCPIGEPCTTITRKDKTDAVTTYVPFEGEFVGVASIENLLVVKSATRDSDVINRWVFDGRVDGDMVRDKTRIAITRALQPRRGYLLMTLDMDGKSYLVGVRPNAASPAEVFKAIKIDPAVTAR